MREAVSAIFLKDEKVFTITRQNYLRSFPGYLSFPGGKVDAEDKTIKSNSINKSEKIRKDHWNALVREIIEELGFDIEAHGDYISDIYELGVAITPSFNPYRFKSHYFVVKLSKDVEFNIDSGEVASSRWASPSEILSSYKKAEALVVPPMIMILEALSKNINHKELLDLSLPFDHDGQVPMIESIYGLKHFLPLSNTFPPANRTNSFLVGDKGKEVLIDPSPRDKIECQKFISTLNRFSINKIFITHHHEDHHEYLRSFEQEYNVPVGMSIKTYELLEKKHGKEYLAGMSIELYQDGDILTQSLGEDILVYEVPGHDAGQLAIAPRNLNWFLVGDLIQTIGTVVVGGADADMKDYFTSLQKVIDLNPLYCVPSHGIAIGGTYKIQKTLKHRMQREKDIIKLLEKGHELDSIVSLLYSDLSENLIPYARATVEAHIIKINKEQ